MLPGRVGRDQRRCANVCKASTGLVQSELIHTHTHNTHIHTTMETRLRCMPSAHCTQAAVRTTNITTRELRDNQRQWRDGTRRCYTATSTGLPGVGSLPMALSSVMEVASWMSTSMPTLLMTKSRLLRRTTTSLKAMLQQQGTPGEWGTH